METLARFVSTHVFGLTVGVPLTLLAIRPLKSMLYELSPFDPVALSSAVAVLTFVFVCAALVPARRAVSVQPMQALRTD